MNPENMIIALQEMLAHQQNDIQNLSDALYQQQQKMTLLEKQIVILSNKFKALQEESNISSESQKPPHY